MHACTCTHQSIAELVGGEGWHSPFPRRLHVGLILLGPVRRLHLHMHARDPATARKRTDAHYSEPQARTTSDMSTGCGQRGRKLAHRSSVQGNYSMTAELEPGGGGQCVCVRARARACVEAGSPAQCTAGLRGRRRQMGATALLWTRISVRLRHKTRERTHQPPSRCSLPPMSP